MKLKILIARDDAGAHGAAFGCGPQIPLAKDIEHHDRYLIIHAEGKCGRVHDLQSSPQSVSIRDRLKALCPRIGSGIGIVDPVHLRRLKKGVGPDFTGTKGGGGVGGEEGMSRSRRKNDHPSLLQMSQGPATNEGFSHVLHLDRRENPSLHAGIFEGILQSERVDYGGQHSHIVGGVAIHLTFIGRGGASPNIPPTDDDAELEVRRKNPFNLVSETLNDRVREVIGGVAQGFPRKFEEETTGFGGVGGSVGVVPMGLPFAGATRNGRRSRGRGFFGGFRGRATGGHARVWRRLGLERKKKVQSGRPRLPHPKQEGILTRFGQGSKLL